MISKLKPAVNYKLVAAGARLRESRPHCAYNQTRECFLGLKVVAGDFSHVNLDDWIPALTPNSGAGLWMVPFRGIPSEAVPLPLDLLYLDQDCCVIDLVESIPAFPMSPSSPSAASVLALPTDSIFSSQTEPGDRLILCAAEEMLWRLDQFSRPSAVASAVPSAVCGPVLVRRELLQSADPALPQSAGPAFLQLEDRSGEEELPKSPQTPKALQPLQTRQIFQALQAQEKLLVEPASKTNTPPRNWLERWLFPDPPDQDRNQRQAPRELASGLVAHFWTGGVPRAHTIRDVSATGLYVMTEERWYPDTLVRMTLTMADGGEQPAERSISVHARAVRWGNDGVGLEFVLQEPRKLRRGQTSQADGADSKQLEEFLQRHRDGNR
ncbi:MAG: PilZ domain-containing protein [Terracidiphilus sp.]|jgi:hypothetical protein